jgi:glycine cleavage system aminomethyltransferase T
VAASCKNLIFSLARSALSHHQGWPSAWGSPDPGSAHDVVIVCGGGHGLATAADGLGGHVTTSYYRPALGRPIALALLANSRARKGERVAVWLEDRVMDARVIDPHFHDSQGERLRL